MLQLRVALDLDGVLVDSIPIFAKMLEKFGATPDLSRYDLGVPTSVFSHAHDYMVAINGFMEAPLYEGAADFVKLLVASGCQVSIITSRRSWTGKVYLETVLKEQTIRYLHEWGIPFHVVHFVMDKPQRAEEIGCSYMVEDQLNIAEDFLNRKPDIKCFLLDRTWNQGNYPWRVRTFNDILVQILK